MKNIKKSTGETSFITGLAIFTYNLFSFSQNTYEICKHELFEGTNSENPFNCDEYVGGISYYYYQESQITLLTIGAILISLGVIIMKRKQ